jgi:hypothetical protein
MERNMVNRNELISYFKHLDKLKEDGVNMNSAILNLVTDFGVWPPDAKSVLTQWFKTYAENKSVEERIMDIMN